MKLSTVHWEYATFLIYFYYQAQYDGSAQSEANLKYAFFATFLILFVFYARLFQS